MNKEEKLLDIAHNNRMAEIKYEMECKMAVERLKHEDEMECQRIKSAEIRKNLARSDWK